MSDNSTSRKISFGPLPEQTSDYSHYEETSLRWDRIGLAAVILFVVAFGLYSALSEDEADIVSPTVTENKQNIAPTPKEPTSLASPETLTKTSDKADTSESNEGSLATTNETNQGKADSPVSHTDAAQINAPKGTLSESSTSQVSTEPTVAAIDKQEALTIAATSKAPKPELDQKAPTNQENTVQDLSELPSPITILHPGITKAQLTSMLDRNGVPVDKLGNIVKMSEEGIIKAVLFVEMTNIRGTRTQHVWYRNGNKQATVNVPVNADLQRSSSSKFINFQMLGDWHVKILDEDNKLLAKAEFEVLPYQ